MPDALTSQCVQCLAGDATPPVITCPETQVVDALEDTCGAPLSLVASAEGACTPEPTLVTALPDVLPLGKTTVSFVAVDGAGNTTTCTTDVTVVDSTGPVVLCEPEVTEVAPPDACGWVGTLTADVVEQCDSLGKMEVQAKQYPVGQTDVLFAAEAQAGNEAKCTSVVTVVDETRRRSPATSPSTSFPSPRSPRPGPPPTAARRRWR